MMQNCELCVQINFFPPTKNTVHKRKIIFLCLSKYFFLWAHSVISHDEDFFQGLGQISSTRVLKVSRAHYLIIETVKRD